MDKSEINRGYVDYLRPADRSPTQEEGSGSRWWPHVRLTRLLAWIGRYLVLCVLLLTTVVVLTYLHLSSLGRRRDPLGEIHAGGLERIDLFVEFYPFHPYPLLAKALELAFLQRELPKVATSSSKIIELAIGDGSLSQHIYPAGSKIVAVDISPFSLRIPAAMPHVRQAVISNCIDPAVASGTFDLLVTNNFLHHVTDKEGVLDHIARIANRAIFNENSTYWASAWPEPFLLGRIGMKQREAETIRDLKTRFLQDLRARSEIDSIVSERFEVDTETAYLCEKTFFLCGIFSRLMGVYGPPAPGYIKHMMQMPVLGPLIRSSTRALGVALIRFDNYQDRSSAAFISYSCRSKAFQAAKLESDFVCAECGRNLPADLKCLACGTEFPSVEGMKFLLPKHLQFIHSKYVADTGHFYEKESLQQHH
jgi:SAM-dependent methyltransferase